MIVKAMRMRTKAPDPSDLEAVAWWKGYLVRALTKRQRDDLAEVVKMAKVGMGVTPQEDKAASKAWAQVWAYADEAEQRRLKSMFGPRRDDWRQFMREPKEATK